MFSLEEALLKEQLLKEMIDATAKSINKADQIIYDGVSYPDSYYNANIRIMWILKEAYETNNVYGWQVGELYNPISSNRSRTAKKLAIINYAILNDCSSQDASTASDADLTEAYKSMARINLSKVAGKKTSDPNLSTIYNVWKLVLLKQLEIYNPDVIICGNTLQYFLNDIPLTAGIGKPLGMNNHSYFLCGSKIYINAYHPSYIQPKNDYVDKIINAVSNWRIKNI
jgi:hypothetical protein